MKERMDPAGFKWVEINGKERPFSPLCEFYEVPLRVQMSMRNFYGDGRLGNEIGVMNPVGLQTDYYKEIDIPYQIVSWDNGELSMVHRKWLIYL
jgi:hypothetical protein